MSDIDGVPWRPHPNRLGHNMSTRLGEDGGQDEDETFLHNPINVYNLIRHVAVGWSVVEQILNEEKKQKKGELPKRVRRVLARKKRSHVPGAEDLDGIATGLVRLHDYYKFDTTR